MRILVAEDERALARAIVKILQKNNYSAEAVHNGADALAFLQTGDYDAAILDIMMPRLDGLTVLRRLRAAGRQTPVLMLTARSEVDDMVVGLDSGANDYLTKPFVTKELLARLRCITRGQMGGDSVLRFGNLSLDRATFKLSTPTGFFRLANKEFQIMEYFLANTGAVFSADRLLEHIWGLESDAELSNVWVYISYLRKKLAALNANVEIRAARNVGYRLALKDD